MAEDKIITPEKNIPVHIKKDGTVMLDIYDVGVKLTAGDTLVIKGSGEGVRIDAEPGLRFTPRLKIETESPVVVNAPSFGVVSGSKQTVIVTTTQTELADIHGLDSKKTAPNPVKSKDAPKQVPSYELSASDKHLTPNQPKAGSALKFNNFSADATLITLGDKETKREIVVESGARADFVNPGDRGNHMLTVLGGDNADDRSNRFRIFATGALAAVKDALDINKPQADNAFRRDKAKYGIPVKQEKGVVNVESPGVVRLEVLATLPMDGKNPFASAPGAAAATAVGEPNSPARLLAVREAIIKYVEKVEAGNTKLLKGDYDNQIPGGRDLAKSLEAIKTQAAAAVSDDGTEVDTKALKALHQELDTYEATTDMMQGKSYKWLSEKGKIPKGEEKDPTKWDVKNVPGYIYNKMDDFKADIEQIRKELDDSEGLSRTRAFSTKGQSRMFDGRENADSAHPFDQLGLPDMLKLSVSSADEPPSAVDAKLPKIIDFLKGKSGGKVA